MELLLVSGMSGAGKTQALRTLEDIGYYCVDNLPPQLFTYLLDHGYTGGMAREKMAVTVDIRSEIVLESLDAIREGLARQQVETRVLFLDADDESLKKRYKETRRLHPLVQQKKAATLPEALAMERRHLESLRSQADEVLDTSRLRTKELRNRLIKLFAPGDFEDMAIEFVAFGFKYGILADADLVFDLRCLPNPFYVEELRMLSGEDAAVREYVMEGEEARGLFARIEELLRFSLPMYRREGKSRLVVGFGCTGGQHRSLAVAGLMQEALEKDYPGIQVLSRDKEENKYEISMR